MSLTQLKQDLRKEANPEKARVLQGFFKTKKGEYGERDVFIGVTVPKTRAIIQTHKKLSFSDTKKLLKSKVHEERLAGLLFLVEQYKKNPKEVYDFYLKHTEYANNWDLVDLTAPKIVGNYLLDKDRKVLYKLAKSKNLWEKRIAIVSTFEFIHNNEFEDTLKISEILLGDKHDLIHKAVGWMLREVGKKDKRVEEKFLKKHYKKMPRTMLRYAIERFEEGKRKKYLKGLI